MLHGGGGAKCVEGKQRLREDKRGCFLLCGRYVDNLCNQHKLVHVLQKSCINLDNKYKNTW